MYPTEWIILASSPRGDTQGTSRGGGGQGGGGQGRGQTDQQGRPTGTTGGGGGTGRQQQRQPWVDDRHPKIIAMMNDYVAAKGLRIQLTDILNAANKRITD